VNRTEEGVEELDLRRPGVDPDRILRLQKYRDLERVSPVIRDIARKMASLAEVLVEPGGWLRREPVRAVDHDGAVTLAGGIEFQSRALARLLGDAAAAVLVILTIGPALELRAQELIADGEFTEGLLLDTAGWVAVDAVIKELRQRLGADARLRGFRLTGRMAPGFSDWGLEQQRILFDAFSGGALSVELTEACVMLPRKSISGIYGLIPMASS
jgi:hypothetical protein